MESPPPFPHASSPIHKRIQHIPDERSNMCAILRTTSLILHLTPLSCDYDMHLTCHCSNVFNEIHRNSSQEFLLLISN
ncbi:hypothetical protein DICVIV_02736 [Dictyocaulus viviparus]|uniref:Uncharacterized protein n=1 Tax=Dictyocaulus viviparus TaxID=29172 RepID=A0A0D8Y4Y2_DICVI|nr:hypothetical protein DICVIV_02736 [Dictyocaulus viviparus]